MYEKRLDKFKNILWTKNYPTPLSINCTFTSRLGSLFTSFVKYPPPETIELQQYKSLLSSIILKPSEAVEIYKFVRIQLLNNHITAFYKEFPNVIK